jgi:hypothetical protein
MSSALIKMMNGYGETQRETLKNGEEFEAIKKDNPEERELTAIEKMMLGYSPKKEGEEVDEEGEKPTEGNE